MADLGALALSAILEADRLGRLSDKTRGRIVDTLDDHAAARVVNVPDADDPSAGESSSQGAAGTSGGDPGKTSKSKASKSGAVNKGA